MNWDSHRFDVGLIPTLGNRTGVKDLRCGMCPTKAVCDLPRHLCKIRTLLVPVVSQGLFEFDPPFGIDRHHHVPFIDSSLGDIISY